MPTSRLMGEDDTVAHVWNVGMEENQQQNNKNDHNPTRKPTKTQTTKKAGGGDHYVKC